MKRKFHPLLVLAVLAVCSSASAQKYEVRAPRTGLLVQGSPIPTNPSSNGPSTPIDTAPVPVYSAKATVTALDFSTVAVGQSAVKSFGVLNTGDQLLTLGTITVSDAAYSAVTSCASTLAPGAECPVQVTFRPTAGKPYPGTVTVNSNASDSPLTVTLAGAGLAPAKDPLWPNVTFLMHMENLADSSQIHATVTAAGAGATITTAAQKFGASALALNGSSALSVPNNTAYSFGTGDFTVEFWLNSTVAWTSQSGSSGILSMKTNDSSSGWVIYRNTTNTNKVAIRITGTNDCYSSSMPTTGAWDHWAVSRQGTTVRWFKNGVLDATCTNGGNITDNAPLYVGYAQTWGGYFKGYVDDVRITKGVARYTAGFTPPTAAFPDQ